MAERSIPLIDLREAQRPRLPLPLEPVEPSGHLLDARGRELRDLRI